MIAVLEDYQYCGQVYFRGSAREPMKKSTYQKNEKKIINICTFFIECSLKNKMHNWTRLFGGNEARC
jgi:hypothetical protein